MHKNKVEICGVNTSQLPVLTNEEMKELFSRMHAGDESAREEFIQWNLRLVLSLIQRFNKSEHIDDLFQVGCIGLIKVDNFDTSHNVRFPPMPPMIIGKSGDIFGIITHPSKPVASGYCIKHCR